jgi:hypothetical protein
LACSLFAHHYSGNRCCFLFLWVLRCFTSPRYLHLPYVFRQGRWAITLHQVSPFGNPRIEVWLPTPRGLSQAPTSFIGSWCQGIHRAPLLTWQIHYGCDARVHCAVLKVRAVPAVLRPPGALQPVLFEGALRPFPQDPTACSASGPLAPRVPSRQGGCTNERELTRGPNNQCSTERPSRNVRSGYGSGRLRLRRAARCSLERR